LKKKSHKSWSR